MNENEMMQEEEISLFDLWDKLREGWRYVRKAVANAQEVLRNIFDRYYQRNPHPALLPVDIR